MCGQTVAFRDGSRIPLSSKKGPQAECVGVSAEEPLAVCSCVASTALVGDEAELFACAFGFTGPVLLTARGGKELDPLRAKLLRRALGDPGGLVQTK